MAGQTQDKKIPIVVALISVMGTIMVGYWQFIYHPEVGKYIGRVTDKTTLNPIKRAKISLDGPGVPPVLFTDDEGIFSFPLKSSGGDARIRVSAPSYPVFEKRIPLSPREEPDDIRLEREKSTENIDEDIQESIVDKDTNKASLTDEPYIRQLRNCYMALKSITYVARTAKSSFWIGTPNSLIHLATLINEKEGSYKARSLKNIGVMILEEKSEDFYRTLLYYIYENQVDVSKVILNTVNRSHMVELVISNKSQDKLFTRVPKGIIFGPMNVASRIQSLAAASDFRIQLEPYQTKHVMIPAFCVLKPWGSPRNSEGAMTILRIANTSYKDQGELWAILKQ